MRVLIIHNHYQRYGGEDAVVAAESKLLAENGFEVRLWTRHNDEIKAFGPLRKLGLAAGTPYNPFARRALRKELEDFRPDVAHIHNTFPLISPSILDTLKAHEVRVVMTLHNFRLVCANGLFYRGGRICEDCAPRHIPWPALRHRCYRKSLAATLPVVTSIALHRFLGTHAMKVDIFIVLNEFTREKFIDMGLPPDKLLLKPNFVSRPTERLDGEGYALYVGRLSSEKGVEVLLKAWQHLPGIPLRLAGDGPIRSDLETLKRARGLSQVVFLGHQSPEEVARLIAASRFLVIPSTWYEMFPMTLAEAFSHKKPVLVSSLGSLAPWARKGGGALAFRPGSPEALAEAARQLWQDSETRKVLATQAWNSYEAHLTPEVTLRKLQLAYGKGRGPSGPASPSQ